VGKLERRRKRERKRVIKEGEREGGENRQGKKLETKKRDKEKKNPLRIMKKNKKIDPPHWRVGATLFTPPQGSFNP
jgi:hypothetical protein